jgi:hypothetical protein
MKTTHLPLRSRLALIAALAAAPFTLSLGLQAQSADALLDKLVEKGVLSVDEANELRDQADKDFTKAYAVKSGIPEWVNALKFNGDFRGRYEGFFADNPNFTDRNRFRYRLRFGAVATLMDNFEVGLRLGSGDIDGANGISAGVDPISQNQSLQNNGSKKGIFLDLAYAKWSPINTPDWQGSFTIGKMENPFVFSDLVFDGDYTPEGAAQQFVYTLSAEGTSSHVLKANLGEFVLDELSASGRDPYLLGGQLRYDAIWNKHWASSLGFSRLDIAHDEQLTGGAVPNINAGNERRVTTNATGAATVGAPIFGFSTLVADASVTYTFESVPKYAGPFPLRVFADYLHNTAADRGENGWQAGVQLGKAGKKGTWEISYRFKSLESNAWYEEMVDSDSGAFYNDNLPATPSTVFIANTTGRGYGSGTNIRGHVIRAGYSPYDSLTLQVTVFLLELIEEFQPSSDSDMLRLQVDAVWKF